MSQGRPQNTKNIFMKIDIEKGGYIYIYNLRHGNCKGILGK
jgi:hypothetical protein